MRRQHGLVLTALRLDLGGMDRMRTLMFILKVAARRILASWGAGCTV